MGDGDTDAVGGRGTVDVATVLEAVSVPTVVLDASGAVVVWDEAVEELVGVGRSAVETGDADDRDRTLVEKVVDDPVTADESAGVDRVSGDHALLGAGDGPVYEATRTAGDGSTEVRSLAEPLYRDGEFVGAVGVVRRRSAVDRERRGRLVADLDAVLGDAEGVDYDAGGDEGAERVRDAVRRLVDEAAAARSKLERERARLEEFASVVSHDLRNPLNVAQGRLELARADGDDEHLAAIARSHDRMGSIIEDALTFARDGHEVTEREAVDLAKTVEACWRTVDPDDATLAVETTATVSADGERLERLLEDLLENAVTHGGAGVSVVVGSTAEGFYVADDGPGVPEDRRDRVFESGYSTADEGTGFGLAIVRAIATAHGWDVRVTEGAEGGARFEVTGVEFVAAE